MWRVKWLIYMKFKLYNFLSGNKTTNCTNNKCIRVQKILTITFQRYFNHIVSSTFQNIYFIEITTCIKSAMTKYCKYNTYCWISVQFTCSYLSILSVKICSCQIKLLSRDDSSDHIILYDWSSCLNERTKVSLTDCLHLAINRLWLCLLC